MGTTWTAPNYESASRLVLADLYQQIAGHKATIGHIQTSLQNKSNTLDILQDRYQLALQKRSQQDTVIQRYQRAVRQSDQRIQDFLDQLERLQAEKQELTMKLVNANQVNCAFEKRLIQYQGLLKAQRKQIQFANACITEKDQVIYHLKKKQSDI